MRVAHTHFVQRPEMRTAPCGLRITHRTWHTTKADDVSCKLCQRSQVYKAAIKALNPPSLGCHHPGMPLINRDYQVVTPAYGRDYSAGYQAKNDFLAGKDFELNSVEYGFGVMCSIRDFASGMKVNIRYSKNTKVMEVTVP